VTDAFVACVLEPANAHYPYLPRRLEPGPDVHAAEPGDGGVSAPTVSPMSTDSAVQRRRSDFAALSQLMRHSRLLERRRGSYAVRVTVTIGAFVATWAAFAYLGNSWWQLFVAIAMGFVFTQVAFIGHDGGHQQIAQSKRANDVIGLIVGDLLVGLSFGWWVSEHNRHHSKPNQEGFDPDIGEGVLAFTTAQAALRTGTVARFITRHQAWLFFPLLTLEGINLHVQAFAWLRRQGLRRYRRLEYTLLSVHTVAYLAAIFIVLSPLKAIVFIAVHQAAWGVYMGCSFAPNHKGMPIIGPDEKLDFLRRQVLTTRNVRGNIMVDFLLGGLNYQVEHHLFPNMPRMNLRRAQPIVRAYCDELRILYTETSLFGSYACALRHLHDIGAPMRLAHGR
jgi:fatty acid desaturase